MITKDSLDQYVGDYSNFAEFERISSKALQHQKDLATHRAALDTQITNQQLHVRYKYNKTVELKALRAIRRTRILVCCGIAVAYLATVLLGGFFKVLHPAIITLLEGVYIFAAIYFLRPGYAEKHMPSFEQRAWKKIYTNPEFCEEIEKAKAEDDAETARSHQHHQNALNQMSKEESYDWLYQEWEQAAKAIKANAHGYGIEDLVCSQSDTKIIDILLRKMPSDNLTTTTYRALIQKAKMKAISDWQECKGSQQRINDMLDRMFK